ncbi:hypothetical protein I2I11_19370 [Pontibacter sp. 172403-2]|uniref:hypothetical protein n=1 Tax=Pontibacter rufus TaxID=2791028 RepID=UPI0018AF78F1|nr:hypothetical protein [Pontibacter sp. 172403-2]MBF9255467.1 hypothetical protein [Pontibacter sp. 172403-2]
MRLFRPFCSLLLCLLLSVAGCQSKSIPCPKPSGKTSKVKGRGGNELEAIRVPFDKNGRIKKRKKLLF